MASKDFTLDDGLMLTVYKRRGNRHLRLSIGPSGKIRVSIPAWAPYKLGVDFARTRQAWIRAQHTPPAVLKQGQQIGKSHHLQFVPKPGHAKVTSRVAATEVIVSYPAGDDQAAAAVQAAAHKAAVRSLRLQAEQLLPQRLASLAAMHGFTYTSVNIKRLKGRWGSCDHQQRIVLNLFLMQLPWELIDYVLLHELAHTRVLRHGPDFWQELKAVLPDVAERRRQLRDYQPALMNG